MKAILVLFALLALFPPAPAAAAEPAPGIPADTKRVVILGDSITHSGQYVDFVEAAWLMAHPGSRTEFINLGLPSDTISGLSEDGHAGGRFPRPDLHERLARVLEKMKPDIIIACYGMNCGIYLPLDQGRFQRFKDGIIKLRSVSEKAGAKVIHLTPPAFDEQKGGHAGYAAVLDTYSEWLLSHEGKGWEVVDAHFPMKKYVEEKRKADPGFHLAGDGVHINETGHWLMSVPLMAHLGLHDAAAKAGPAEFLTIHPKGAELLGLVKARSSLLKLAWLSETKHLRPGIAAGLPIAEAEAKAAEITRQIDALGLGDQ